MNFGETKLNGLYVIHPEVKGDERGFFMEVFRQDIFKENGLDLQFVQVNHSRSGANVLRGLHFQYDKPLGKLIRVINGCAYVVAADIRKNSKTLGQWFGLELSAENKKLLYVPEGFASGFCVIGDIAEVEYQYTALYNINGESNILWDDPDLNVDWPMQNPIISERDKKANTLYKWLKKEESNIF
jgi:dTDP-4-dehydrorhamnose 3,5-epimerase